MSAELFKAMTGTDILHVPYKGSGQAMPDLMSGRVQMMFENAPGAVSHIRAGKLRALAQTGLKRSPAMPDVPTFIESGLKDYEVDGWYGLVMPGRTPKAMVNRLSTELRNVLNDADTQKRFAQRGMDPLPSTPEEFGALIKSEIVKWAKVVKAAGIEPE